MNNKETYINIKIDGINLRLRTGSIELRGNKFIERNDKGEITSIEKLEQVVRLVTDE